MSDRRDNYRIQFDKTTPLFHLRWWLDAVCGDQWDVINLPSTTAYYLYCSKKTRWGTQIIIPPLTQFLGPNYQLTSSSVRERNNEETEILEQLLSKLPVCSSFESRWQYPYQNWLPFHWKNFQQRTRYTYVLPDISDPNLLRKNFSEKIQREISKAEKQFNVIGSDSIEVFFSLLSKNFRGKGMKVPFEKQLLQKVFDAATGQRSGKVSLATDQSGNPAAGIFVAWDAHTAYYIIGARDEAFGNSGAMSLLFWNAFNELKDKVKSFDFEGSMIKGVENYFRSFGAEQKGFFEITKINSPVLKVKSSIKSLLKHR